MNFDCIRTLAISLTVLATALRISAAEFERIKYNNPGLIVDLGVGLWAWPIPVDADDDGDLDIIVSCPDKPYNGIWLFENPSGHMTFPTFKPARRLSKAVHYVCPSYVDSKLRVLTPGLEYPDFLQSGLDLPVKLSTPNTTEIHTNRFGRKPGVSKIRHNQWRYVDYDSDGKLDLVVAIEDWADYGWDDAYDKSGHWTNGPLHGVIYLLQNNGTTAQPSYAMPVLLEAGGKLIDTFGCPSPCFADFDGDGDGDLICGEFLDRFTYFENVGTRTEPRYTPGRRFSVQGKPLTMDLQMIVPVGMDWNKDGRVDLIVGDEDGRVALIENTGKFAHSLPQFLPPKYFQQEADEVKVGALATPVGFDWDDDGDDDLLCGSTAGYIDWIVNLSGPGVEQPRFSAPRHLEANGKVIRIQAGPNGSIQGPAEAKWGYTTLSIADWDGDGLPDLIVNSIWGKVICFRNLGTRKVPKLTAAAPIKVEWPGKTPKPAWTWWEPQGKELVTQWRTTPVAVDWNRDGLVDLVMLDHEGYLAFFERAKRDGKLVLLPPRRAFVDEHGQPLKLSAGPAGKSGRRKLCIVDWDGDGNRDILLNGENANFLRQVETRDSRWFFKDLGKLATRNVASHDVSPTVVDWNNDSVPDLLAGAEDGHLYYLKNPRAR